MVNDFREYVMNYLESIEEKSAFGRGVIEYAKELCDDLCEYGCFEKYAENMSAETLEKDVLNGAANFETYSYGGFSLIMNYDIAERLCTATEFKNTHYGEKEPNKYENWLDVQARALKRAYGYLKSAVEEALRYFSPDDEELLDMDAEELLAELMEEN